MALPAGARLGPYEILNPLGSGGMGEVYRARDSRLDRHVAIKVLPGRVAADSETLARFQREAKIVAALSHPNILALHEFGTDDGTAYAVTELLEGQTLRDRLSADGALPVRKAMDYAAQIALGLAAAHDRGVIHRDLKPENVFVTVDGHLKILDFGLARQATLPGADDHNTLSRLTGSGTILGTVGYMSPEQVRAQETDHRSDIFSFGCLLHELLTGRPPFRRETAAETMTAILRDDPPDLPPAVTAVAPGLAPIVGHCLEKRPEDRFQSARDLAFDLRSVAGSGTSRVLATAAPMVALARSRRMAGRAGWFLAGGLVAAAAMATFGPAAEAEPPKLRRLTYSGADSEPSASPDGRLIAFTSGRDGISRIWIKQLAGGGEAPLTAGPDRMPRFSPDGANVLFVRDEGQTQSVYRIALVGGEPRKMVHDAVDADWSPDGRAIAFVRQRTEPGRSFAGVYVTDAQGRTERRLVELENASFFGVRWSPDGERIGTTRATTASSSVQAGVMLLDARSGEQQLWSEGEALPISALAWQGAGDELLLARSESQMGNLTGALSRVFGLRMSDRRERMLFWASDLFPAGGNSNILPVLDVLGRGKLVFDALEERQTLLEVPVGSSTAGERVLTRGRSVDRQPAYSPDGEHVIFSSNRSGNLDLSVVSTKTGAIRQLTDDPADDWDPAFTPDGRHIVWSSSRSGSLEIWIASADGSAARQITQAKEGAENPTATAGGWIVYTDDNPDGRFRGIWKVRTDGTDATRLLAGPHSNPEVSPDGRFALAVRFDRVGLRNQIRVVAIESGEIVPFEIAVPYQLSAPNIVLGRARWLPDGRAIAFVGVNEQGRSGIFAQDFTPGRDSAATRRPVAGFSSGYITESFGIAPDGRRLTLSILEQLGSIVLAEGVPGVESARRRVP